MELLLFHLEIAGIAALVVGLHALRPRFGLAPLYMGLGLVLAYMMIAARLKLSAPVLGGETTLYTSVAFLPPLLVGVALLYTLEGTREAQRFLVTVVAIKILLNVLKWLMAERLQGPGIDVTLFGRERWLGVDLWATAVSTGAIVAAACAIVVVYQGLLNLWQRVPIWLALAVALVAAMLTDALVFAGLTGRIATLQTHIVAKLSTGLAVSIPAAVYINWRLSRAPADARRGVLERGALDIVDLRRQLRTMRADLSRKQAEFDHLKHLFSRYVVPDVVDELLADTSQFDLDGEVRDVTVLFSNIRGYSILSARMGPTDVIGLINRYFGAMSAVVDAERGTIIEFEGDAILVVFGAPLQQPDHADRAVRAAVAMHRAAEKLDAELRDDGTSELWRDLGVTEFGIRIGIHSGEVVVGNVGSQTRTKYAVIGDTVNIAARVEQMNKKLHTGMLFTGATVERMSAARPDQKSLGMQPVRGRAEDVEVFGIDGIVVGQPPE